MPGGLQVFDSSGNLVVDITSRLVRFVGSVRVNGGNASVPDSRLATGALIYAFQPDFIWGFQNMDISRPIFSPPCGTMGATVISWNYSGAATSQNEHITGTLFYGIY